MFVINNINAIQNAGDTFGLIWAPINTVRFPYVTFLNDFNRPTWWSRHSMTKQKTQFQHLELPKNIPFAVVCGACFQNSKLKTNLTMTISNHLSQSVPKKKRDGSFEYNVGFNECLMTYMVTEPIQKDGSITCSLNRGIKTINETISFNAVEVNIKKPAEELEIDVGDNELHCPEINEKSPVIHVWYVEVNNSVVSPILNTRPTVTLLDLPKYTPITIVCSVYKINTPNVVFQLRYKILQSDYHSSHNVSQDDALSGSMITFIIIAVTTCVLLGIIGAYRFVGTAVQSN